MLIETISSSITIDSQKWIQHRQEMLERTSYESKHRHERRKTLGRIKSKRYRQRKKTALYELEQSAKTLHTQCHALISKLHQLAPHEVDRTIKVSSHLENGKKICN